MKKLNDNKLNSKKKLVTMERIKEKTAYKFILIPVIYFIIVRFIPTIFSFILSVMEWNLLSPKRSFVALENYEKLFQDEDVITALINTFEYVLICVPVIVVLSVILGVLLNHIKKGRGFFRLVVFIPYVTSVSAISYVWKWMFMEHGGVINSILMTFGISQQPFLNSNTQAIYVIMSNVIWSSLGFNTIIVLAGLMQIPKSYYEAAQVDGANAWQQFTKITIPQLNPTLTYVGIMSTIKTLQVFTQIYNIADVQGGPLKSTSSIVLEIYLAAFKSYDMGYASAMTVVLFVIILIITIFQMKVLNREID